MVATEALRFFRTSNEIWERSINNPDRNAIQSPACRVRHLPETALM
jgi:hypothetical protein